MKIGVYCIICLANQKVYIGQSCNIKQRWSRHRYDLKNQIHKNKDLQIDYNTYKKEMFSFNILEICNKEDLLNKEKFWIDKYDSIDKLKGFNCTSTIEDKRRRQEINISLFNINKKSRPIKVYNKDTNEFISTFNSIAQCARELNLSSKKIQEVCSGKRYGTKWKRKFYKEYIFEYDTI